MTEPRNRFLFDENLAARVAVALAKIYPGSIHVGDAGLRAASDMEIWRYAGSNGLTIVSKDEDFQRLSVLYGPPPKVIWLRLGNCSTEDVIRVLRRRRTGIEAFLQRDDAGFLELS